MEQSRDKAEYIEEKSGELEESNSKIKVEEALA